MVKQISDKGSSAGIIGMSIVSVILMAVNLTRGELVYDIIAMLTASSAATFIYLTMRLRTKRYLFVSVCYVIVTLCCIGLHIVWG